MKFHGLGAFTILLRNLTFFFFVSSKNYNPLNITESQVGTGIPEFSTYEPHVDLCYIN